MNLAKTRKQTMTPQEEDRILRHAEYVDAGLVRVECLRLTLPVLRKAGFTNPRPFERYLVAVRYRQDMPLLEVKSSFKG